ncbi:unnamed protein product [Polarella glacialis]|uniref:PDZ domain-containing protein n=1 Tax=Polarella glacialis TaxID=89957 RepID=A0A813I450_POLGL|nr:unnamed protein product [Polarella glacialis]
MQLPVMNLVDLPPVEAGIKRFEFKVDEVGPLGLRFSGGFPPMILAVLPDTFAQKKKIPANYEVHAINGLPMVPENRDAVMSFLKSRPVIIDLRPLGWKPQFVLQELEKRKAREEVERLAKVAIEEQRRVQVIRETAEETERQAAEKAAAAVQEKAEHAVALKRAVEERHKLREKEEAFKKAMALDPKEWYAAAAEVMEADYGSDIKITGRRGLPLRVMTRRKEVSWLWNGEAQELIGGGNPDEWTETE